MGIELEVRPGRQRAAEREADAPFRILVLGDFSGRANRGICEPAAACRRTYRIDRDNFDQVLARLRPQLCIRSGNSLSFSELDDFHPDRLHERLPAVEEDAPAPEPEPEATPPRPVTLEDLLGETPRPRDEFRKLVDDLVAPHLVPRPAPKRPATAAAARMRAVLHDPAFQALEAAWRALFFLIRRVEDDVHVHLLDISRAELAADLLAAEDLKHTQIWKPVVQDTVGTPGAERWSMLIGNYTFGPDLDDVDLLARLAMLARAAGPSFAAAASPEVLKLSACWQNLRDLPEARWAGLALPRFLLRLPYGSETDRIDSFDFEEFAGPAGHEQYLWGNPAFAIAAVVACGSRKRDIDGLPAHVYREEGELKLKPCAEVLLTEEQAEKIVALGLMPLVSLKGRDVVRVISLQSLAGTPLIVPGRDR